MGCALSVRLVFVLLGQISLKSYELNRFKTTDSMALRVNLARMVLALVAKALKYKSDCFASGQH